MNKEWSELNKTMQQQLKKRIHITDTQDVFGIDRNPEAEADMQDKGLRCRRTSGG